MYQLVLASQSPRRSELLSRAGFEFAITSSQISEIPDKNLNLDQQIQDLALQKAVACLKMGKVPKGQRNLLLSADTVVVLGGQILGKPVDRTENKHFLDQLSGQTHSVITGVCLLDADTGRTAMAQETTLVTFHGLSENEKRQYSESGEGLDKAGGYGIQGAAASFVEKVEGPIDNVIGLPVALVEKLLRENGWNVKRH